ncbi:MAG TPA: acyl-CoA dehydrogenase family protein [Actinomycetota bacterium]|nr:acyl-CoA dehydrogenase family protein [Actinomycetota bacterium]
MDFAFSDEQQMLRSSARQFLSEKLSLERVAEIADGDEGWDRDLWRAIGELGWIGLSVPEARGGAGTSYLDEAVLFEELGYALFPGPYLATVALALPVLAVSDMPLDDLIAGRAAATLAWAEGPGAYHLSDLGEIGTKAEPRNGSWTLSGQKELIVDLGLCDTVAVVAKASDGLGVWSLAADSASPVVLRTVDRTRRLGRLELNAVEASVVVEPGSADDVLREVRLRLLAALALEAVGIAQRAQELAIEHAKTRQQFDKPIGTYQAVSHPLADTYADTERARSLAYWAAWCVAEKDPQAPMAAAAAKSFAAEAAVLACERAIQVHGGIGFTWEHVLHRLYKRAEWIEAFEGIGASHRSDIAAEILAEISTD